jgi:hemoglobin
MIIAGLNEHELYALILKINQIFYDKVYEHPWLKDIFKVIKQEIIESQQTDFIVGAMGGPMRYCGRSPKDAHPHMVVTEEMWDLREALLIEAFEETDCPEEIRERWLKVDMSFKAHIIQPDPEKCQKRYASDEIIYVPNPYKRSA